MMIASGKVFDLFILIVFMAVTYITIHRAKKGKYVHVRRLAGLDAIEEAIGRATEMGRPAMMIPGFAGVDYSKATGDTVAGFSVLYYVARLCARLRIPLIVPIGNYVNLPFAEEQVKSAYMMEGQGEAYRPEFVRYVAAGQFAFGAAVMGILARERPAANIMVGFFWSESIVLAEAGATVGAIQVGGTSNTTQIPYFVVSCDYTLIGEEVYAAGVYLSRDPEQLGSLQGGDYSKIIVVAIMVLTMLFLLTGSGALIEIMRW